MVQKSVRKDINELFYKRKNFLDKNYHVLPGIKNLTNRSQDVDENQAYNEIQNGRKHKSNVRGSVYQEKLQSINGDSGMAS